MSSAPKQKESTWDFIKTFIWAVGIALVFRSFCYEPFHIPSESMLPTLEKGDYIFVSKLSYGYSRYSFPFGTRKLFDGFEGRILSTQPKRGDVIVFRLPINPRIDYIKRLVGLPGDKIQVINGLLYVNGIQASQRKIKDFQAETGAGEVKFIPRFMEQLPDGPEHVVLDEKANYEVDNTDEYVVPKGHYFFMGDNRDNSVDSRYLADVGYVKFENIIGRADIIMVSANPNYPLSNPIAWLSNLRFERFFRIIR